MTRVFMSEASGAGVYVFSDDHCPPHVHARHRGDGWIARVTFSYLGHSVRLLSIAPLKNTPLQRTVNRLLDDIKGALTACRRSWWATRQTTCLGNQWAILQGFESIGLAPETTPGAKQIADAIYDPDDERLRVTFQDGTAAEVSTRQ